jgi:dihydroorotate dehydrogenase (NAD+) catalytic subunit
MFKRDLTFRTPWMNAAGTLGYTPNLHSGFDWSRLGAFVTNPVSLVPRQPAEGRALLEYPGGFLLHTGWPNPGLRAVLNKYAANWSRGPLAVIVHLLAGDPAEVSAMIARLEGLEGVVGIELGLAPDISADEARVLASAAESELPFIPCLPLERAGELAAALSRSGASAFSLAAPRGMLLGADGRLVSGRLYGPGVLPSALAAARAVIAQGLPLIAAGGVYRPSDGQAFLDAGALAVQLDAVLWKEGEDFFMGEKKALP